MYWTSILWPFYVAERKLRQVLVGSIADSVHWQVFSPGCSFQGSMLFTLWSFSLWELYCFTRKDKHPCWLFPFCHVQHWWENNLLSNCLLLGKFYTCILYPNAHQMLRLPLSMTLFVQLDFFFLYYKDKNLELLKKGQKIGNSLTVIGCKTKCNSAEAADDCPVKKSHTLNMYHLSNKLLKKFYKCTGSAINQTAYIRKNLYMQCISFLPKNCQFSSDCSLWYPKWTPAHFHFSLSQRRDNSLKKLWL